MSVKPYESQIMKIGLSDKESKVYLASLELGPASVQKIAQKADVKRATTYVAIEALIDRGLMSTFNNKKKRLFTAESPQMLIGVLEEEKRMLSEKQNTIKDILPHLEALSESAGKRPHISFFEGVDGLRAIHEDILRTKDTSLENIVSLDDALKVEQTESYVSTFRNRLINKGVHVRILYSSESQTMDLPVQTQQKWLAKKMPQELLPIHGELTLYGSKVAAFSFRGKIFGTIIESEEVSNTMRALFELAWSSTHLK